MIQTALWWIGAVIVALIAILIIRKASYGSGPHWAVVVLILVVAGNVAWFGDRYVRHLHARHVTDRVVAGMEQDPVFAAIKEADPATYARIKQAVADTEGFPDDERADRSRDLSMAVMMDFMVPRFAHPNDEMVVKSARLGLNIAKRRISSGGRCDLAQLRYNDGERWKKWRSNLSGDEGSLVKEFLVDMIRSEPDMSPKAYDPSQARLIMAGRIPMILERGGIQLNVLADAPDEDTRCRIGILMIEDILSMPHEQAAPMLRSFARVTMS